MHQQPGTRVAPLVWIHIRAACHQQAPVFLPESLARAEICCPLGAGHHVIPHLSQHPLAHLWQIQQQKTQGFPPNISIHFYCQTKRAFTGELVATFSGKDLFVYQSFHSKMFLIRFNYIRQGSKRIQRKHFATVNENLWVGSNSPRCCCSFWRELEETRRLRLMSFLLLFHQLQYPPLLVFKASEMLLLPSPGWRAREVASHSYWNCSFRGTDTKSQKMVMKIFPNYYHQMWLLMFWFCIFPKLKLEIMRH